MAVAARKVQNEYVYTHSSTMRVYTHRAAQAAPQVQSEPQHKAAERPAQGLGILKKLAVTCCILVAAVTMLLILMRYAMITEQYAVVNEYKQTIEENQRTLTELEVKLNSAVSLEEAREAALAAGLGYPSVSQIVTINGAAYAGTQLSPQ